MEKCKLVSLSGCPFKAAVVGGYCRARTPQTKIIPKCQKNHFIYCNRGVTRGIIGSEVHWIFKNRNQEHCVEEINPPCLPQTNDI